MNISFALQQITTEQFAIIEEGFIDKGKINVVTKIRFACDDSRRMLACFSEFTFESDGKPFIIIEASCQFNIAEVSWNQMIDLKTGNLIAPKGFLTHLSVLTIGTSRGILHVRTENTCFNKYILPTINIATLFPSDVIFDFKTGKAES